MPYTFDLDFEETGKDDLPFGPRAHVMVSTYRRRQNDGATIIGIECVSATEFDYEIDRLIKELNEVRKKGHRRFAVANDRMRSRFGAR
jgi:hypothetical protein